MPKKPKKITVADVAKAYRKNTKTKKQAYSYQGTFGSNPVMDSRIKESFPNLKPGDTYASIGTMNVRIPKGKAKPMSMTYGGERKGKPITKYIKKMKSK
jgi:hypothetical protein